MKECDNSQWDFDGQEGKFGKLIEFNPKHDVQGWSPEL